MNNELESLDVDQVATATGGNSPAVDTDGRDWLVWLLIVLATTIAVFSGFNVWLQRQLLDTESWVAASDELLADDDVRGAISVFLVDQLYETVDVSSGLEDRLPEDFSGLAGPLSAALRGPATEAVDRLLNTQGAREIWNTANEKAHSTMVAILRDEGDRVSSTDGVVTLELGDLVRELSSEMGLPDSLIENIPDDAGQLVLIESDNLEAAQNAVRLVEWASSLLFLMVVGMYVGAVMVASKSRRMIALRNVGWAIALGGVLLLLLRRAGVGIAVSYLAEIDAAEAPVRSVALIATGVLQDLAWSTIAIGVMIAIYATLSGKSKAALATRRVLAPLLRRVALAWVAALAALYLFMSVYPGFDFRRWGPALVFISLFVVGVEVFRRRVVREFPDTGFSSAQPDLLADSD